MDEIIVSIPYTGTRFLKERLGIDKHVHTIVDWNSLTREIEGKHIIAPLRNPKDVWASDVRRWLKWDAEDNIPRFVAAWYVMHTLTLIRDVDFIPVDLQQDNRITDWTPVSGELERNNKKHPQICLRRIYALPFVGKYYGNGVDARTAKELTSGGRILRRKN